MCLSACRASCSGLRWRICPWRNTIYVGDTTGRALAARLLIISEFLYTTTSFVMLCTIFFFGVGNPIRCNSGRSLANLGETWSDRVHFCFASSDRNSGKKGQTSRQLHLYVQYLTRRWRKISEDSKMGNDRRGEWL